MALHTAIPVDPTTLKRNDRIRIRDPRGITRPVLDGAGQVIGNEPLEYVDVRVTGVKVTEHDNGTAGIRVNAEYPDGSKRSHFFERNPERMRYARGFDWVCALRPVLAAALTADYPPDIEHDDAPSDRYLADAVGDIAYRCGEVGAWLRVGGRWAECPVLWRWGIDPRKWTVLL